MERQKLYEKGLENYPKARVVLTNVSLIIWFGFTAYGMSALKLSGLPSVSIVYLFFTFVMLGFILRKHLCTHCYYYSKWCGSGLGKLSSCLFEEKSGNYELGMKMAGLTWGLLTVVPMIAIPVWEEKGCAQCKMRYVCEASAAE